MPRTPRLSVEKAEEATVIRIAAADMQEEVLQEVGKELFRIAEETAGAQLVVDLSKVDFLTSSALGKFVALNTRMKAGGGRLVLANVPEPIYEIFSVTSLDRILDIRRQADDGLPLSTSPPLAS